MSIIDPLTCGFAKVAAYNIFNVKTSSKEKSAKAKIFKQQHEKFNQYFSKSEENFNVDYKRFVDNFPKILKQIKDLNKRHGDYKNKFMKTFSKENWVELSELKQSMHTLSNCKGCLKDKALKQVLAEFPVKNKHKLNVATQAGLYKEKHLSDTTNKIVVNLDKQFEEQHNTTFVRAAKKHVDSFQDNNNTKKLARDIIKDCEQQYSESAVVRYVTEPAKTN